MDMMSPDESQARSLLASLLHQTCLELAEWGREQAELGMSGLPAEISPWGELPNVASTTQIQSAPVSVRSAESGLSVQTVRRNIPEITQPEPVKKMCPSGNGSANHSFDSYTALRSEKRFSSLSTTPEEKRMMLDKFKSQLMACKLCSLGGKRRDLVWGIGPADASVMFVAAGGNPAEIDARRIMTGEAAELLDRIVAAMAGIHSEARAERIYMTNVIKCACCPPRGTALDCARHCLPWLQKEVRAVSPQVIVVWGELAYRAMFGGDALISQIRGTELVFEGVKTIATHHPIEMLKNPGLKARVWADMKLALSFIKNKNEAG